MHDFVRYKDMIQNNMIIEQYKTKPSKGAQKQNYKIFYLIYFVGVTHTMFWRTKHLTWDNLENTSN